MLGRGPPWTLVAANCELPVARGRGHPKWQVCRGAVLRVDDHCQSRALKEAFAFALLELVPVHQPHEALWHFHEWHVQWTTLVEPRFESPPSDNTELALVPMGHSCSVR